VATSSCTTALFVALRGFGVGPGDEVIVPSLTFAATINTVLHCGAVPVLADIESESFGLDPEAVASLVTPRTRGIVTVDYAGHPSRVDALVALAREHGLFLLEDAAHAFGAALGGRPVGSLADATAFSFYATKCITTGEGGMLTCLDEGFAHQVRLLGYHGMARDAWRRYSDRGSWYYEVELPGYKCNMTDVQAALGLSQLGREPELRASRREVAAFYSKTLAGFPALELPSERPGAEHAWHLFVVRLQTAALRCDRDRFARALREEGVVPSVHFIPYHRHPAGRALERRGPLDRTDDFASRCLTLPLFPHMPPEDSRDVVEALTKLLRYYAR
jgi:dTDP-4-amino-4,6-dideoxygalactose transaminase